MNLLAWLRSALQLPESAVRIPRLTETMIYCAECSIIDEHGLIKTFLTTAGRCHQCSGRSYVLASKAAPVTSEWIKAQRQPPEYPDTFPIRSVATEEEVTFAKEN